MYDDINTPLFCTNNVDGYLFGFKQRDSHPSPNLDEPEPSRHKIPTPNKNPKSEARNPKQYQNPNAPNLSSQTHAGHLAHHSSTPVGRDARHTREYDSLNNSKGRENGHKTNQVINYA